MSLSPSGMRRRCLSRQHLPGARLRNFGNLIHAAPLRRYHEQRFFVCTSQHTREATAVEVDCLLDLAALADADTALVGNVRVPNAAIGVQADAIGNAAAKIGPDSSIRQTAVGSNVEGGQ